LSRLSSVPLTRRRLSVAASRFFSTWSASGPLTMRRVELAMAGLTTQSLATSELLNNQLRTLAGAKDLAGNGNPRKRWAANLQTALVAEGQHAIERDRAAAGDVAVVELNLLPLFDLELPPPVFNDRVHVSSYVSVDSLGLLAASTAALRCYAAERIVSDSERPMRDPTAINTPWLRAANESQTTESTALRAGFTSPARGPRGFPRRGTEALDARG